jgi:Site-specific DNA methylase
MSIAGRRAGLDGSRSNLFYEAIRIIKEMRDKTNGKYPRYAVWENVTGALSSNSGEDFKSVIENFCQIKDSKISVPRPAKWQNAGVVIGDGFSLGYRVVDSRYFGVAQRRRRIYIVCDFAGNGGLSLFTECGRLPWNTSKSFKAWKSIACPAEKGSGATSGTNVENIVLCDQGGERMDIHENIISTLRAQAHHPPIVMESAGFCTEHSANARSIGYEEEISPTLRAGTVPAAVFENHSADTRYTGPLDIAPTISATYGKGGNNQPFVVHTPQTLKIRGGKSGGGKGPIWQTDMSATLSTNNDQVLFEPKCYGICSLQSNAMKSDNPNSGFYEADTARTLDTGTQSPNRGQGGIAVVSIQGSMIGRKDKNGPQGSGIKEDVSFSLTASDKHCVAYGIDRAAFNQGQNALYNIAVEEELEPTIVAKGPGAVAQPTYCTSKNSHHTKANVNIAGTLVESDYKDPPVVNDTDGIQYIVRRLTPSECAALQGFPTDWCSDLGTENPTAEDIVYWREMFNEYNRAIGKNTKPKSDKQIIKWLKNPHSDSAEYALWGNAITVNVGVFVLSGIAYFDSHKEEYE